MALLGLSSLVLTTLVVVLSLVMASLARQIGVLHERTQPMASRTTAATIHEGDIVNNVELPGSASSGDVATLLFVATSCQVCAALHRTYAELTARGGVDHGYWVFPMDTQEAIDVYSDSHGLPSDQLLISSSLAASCAVTSTPTLVRLQYSDNNWRMLLRRRIQQPRQLYALLQSPAIEIGLATTEEVQA